MKRNPIKYYGGKQRLSNILVNYIPIHDVFVEVFGGAGNLIVKKDPKISKMEVYNDINDDIVNLFKVLRNENKFKLFQRQVELMPYSRKEYLRYNMLYKSDKWKKIKDYKKAAIYFYLLRSSFSAIEGWSFNRKAIALAVEAYLSAVKLLPELANRFRTVQIECSNYKHILNIYDSEKTFFYLDPPYLPETRVAETAYKFEMPKKEHKKLLKVARKAKGMVLFSGYSNKLYDKALKEWGREEIDVSLQASNISIENDEKRPRRIEVLWYNYSLPKSKIRSRKRLF